MSIERNHRGIWGILIVGTVILATNSGGCEADPIPSPPEKFAGCNGAGFIVKLKPEVSVCPSDNELNQAAPGDGTWRVDAICGDAAYLPKTLRGYCSVAWVPNTGVMVGAPDAKDLYKVPSIESIEEDCLVTAPQSSSPTQLSGPTLYNQFRRAAGVTFDPGPLATKAFRQTFISALDTLPHNKTGRLFGPAMDVNEDPFPFAKDEHGWLVLALIDDLTTYDFEVRAPGPIYSLTKPDAQLALPGIDLDNIDEDNGGFFGRQFHLANAICGAIETWRSNTVDPRKEPAPVLVMAVGALPLEGQECDSEAVILAQSALPTKIIYYAMQHAACHGAAIVAAAGNDPNGKVKVAGCEDEVPGATCPGAMSQIQAPTRAQCLDFYEGTSYDSELFKIHDPSIDPNLDNPLVYMISGVDGAGALLSTSRESGTSKLAAIGELGSAKDKYGSWHAARTGTSIATAVTGAAFATLFAFNPELTAAKAADILYHSAVKNDELPPQIAADGNEVRVISICRALEESLGLSQQLGCADEIGQTPPALVEIADFGEFSPPPLSLDVVALGSPTSSPSATQCAGNSPLLNPAPGSTRCPDCGYLVGSNGGSGEAYIHLADGNEVTIQQLTLVLRSKNSDVVDEAFVLENFGFPPGSTLRLGNITSAITAGDLRSVTFEALVEGDGYSSVVSGEIPIFKRP
jgi:Subtilase family